MKIRTTERGVRLSRNSRQCTLQVSGNTLQQVEKFKYLGVAFTSDGRQNKELDTRIGKANAVLRELYRAVVAKRELSNAAKLSFDKSAFLPVLTFGHESYVATFYCFPLPFCVTSFNETTIASCYSARADLDKTTMNLVENMIIPRSGMRSLAERHLMALAGS